VKWIPDWGVNRIKGAVQSRPDWCISASAPGACRFPRFTTRKAKPILDAQIVRNAADLIENTAQTSGSRNPPPNSGRS
jgi:isoleucyl-tRNA synthetase